MFPVFYALLPGKSKKIYENLFKVIKQKSGVDILNTKAIVMSDFEIANFNFFGKNVMRKCCFFHFCQNIWRYSQKIAKDEYTKRGSFYLLSRSLMVLPLIKKERIDQILEYLKNKYTLKIETDLLNYFTKNYINGKYDISQWNLLDVPIRNNNWLESFHSMINRLFRFNHPPVSDLIKALNKIIINERIKYYEIVEKKNLPRQKKKFVKKQIHIWI